MKHTTLAMSLIAFITTSLYVPESQASNDDCAIWLCLPTGFPSGCGSAKRAFKKRIKKGKSPLPSLGSCLISHPLSTSDNHNITSQDGFAALIPEHNVCTEWSYTRTHKGETDKVCVKQKIVPTQAIKGTRCNVYQAKDERPRYTPEGCSTTIRYVDTYMNGQPYGNTYYFDSAGNEIHIP